MAKEIRNNSQILEDETEPFTVNKSNILYREHLEYTSSKIFWASAYGLIGVTIYATVAFLLVQQLRK